MLVRFCVPEINPDRTSRSLRFTLLYRANNKSSQGETSLSSGSIFLYLLNSFALCMKVVCFQKTFHIIVISFPNKSSYTCCIHVAHFFYFGIHLLGTFFFCPLHLFLMFVFNILHSVAFFCIFC